MPRKLTPLLFLDYDGVLHPASPPFKEFCCAERLALSLQGLSCDIVISSSWRFHRSPSALTQGLPAALRQRVVGTTGAAYVGRWARYEEINAWRHKHSPLAPWRALDDARLEFPKGCAEVLWCNPTTGLCDRVARELRDWLVAVQVELP